MSIAHVAAPPAPSDRAGLARWETAAAALCVAQFSEPLFAAVAQAQGLTEPPGYARLFFLPVAAFLGWAIWRDRTQARRAVRAAPLLMVLLALAMASTLWSIEPGATLRRAAWLALTMGFGLYLAWRYEWRQLLAVLGGGLSLLVGGAIAVALLAPDVGRMTGEHAGAWSGLWTHKNTLGGVAALAAVLCCVAAIEAPERRWRWSAAALAALALVGLSASKSALLASLLGLGAVGLCLLLRRGPVHATAAGAAVLVGVILGAGVLLVAPELVFAAFGRDLSLTGRTEIWEASARFVAERPWLGYGYYAFWLADAGPAYWVRQALAWQAASAHSGWLELALGLGRAGVTLFAAHFLLTLVRGARAALSPASSLMAPAFLAVFALYTLSESHVLEANDPFWLIYVAVATRLALDAKRT
jgi:O-antigen ligase